MNGFWLLSADTNSNAIGDAQENRHILLGRNCHRKHVEDG